MSGSSPKPQPSGFPRLGPVTIALSNIPDPVFEFIEAIFTHLTFHEVIVHELVGENQL